VESGLKSKTHSTVESTSSRAVALFFGVLLARLTNNKDFCLFQNGFLGINTIKSVITLWFSTVYDGYEML